MHSNLIKTLEIADKYGIKSLGQLTVFLTCAQNLGKGLYDIYGYEAIDPQYKRVYTNVRKLMRGDPSRANDGLRLLRWGRVLYRRERAVELTEKGRRLLELMS